jgi:membrane fusion protein, multidrug efflux system
VNLVSRLRRSLVFVPLVVSCRQAVADPEAIAPPKPPVAVTTEVVVPLKVPRSLRLTGTLRGNREAELAANSSGRVVSVSMERGAPVKMGQVLATLDLRAATLSAAEARAQAESVRAQEEQARQECERYEALKAKGALSELEYTQRMTQCRTLPLSAEAATARAALATQTVGDAEIRAPFSGVIAERYLELGQYVRQDSRVATLVATDPIRLEFAVPEAEVGKVAEGSAVTFRVSAHPDQRFRGSIRFVSGVVRRDTRDLVVEAVIENRERKLLPGMFAEVELTVGAQELPSVPQTALVQREEHARVFVLNQGRVEERVLALGPTQNGRVAVLQGVSAGERVVTSDPSGLINGQRAQ